MPAPGRPAHGLQLWVNLAAKDKMVPPAYQEVRHLATSFFTGGVGFRFWLLDVLVGVLALAADSVLTSSGNGSHRSC